MRFWDKRIRVKKGGAKGHRRRGGEIGVNIIG